MYRMFFNPFIEQLNFKMSEPWVMIEAVSDLLFHHGLNRTGYWISEGSDRGHSLVMLELLRSTLFDQGLNGARIGFNKGFNTRKAIAQRLSFAETTQCLASRDRYYCCCCRYCESFCYTPISLMSLKFVGCIPTLIGSRVGIFIYYPIYSLRKALRDKES